MSIGGGYNPPDGGDGSGSSHDPVTLGDPNGLELVGQELSLNVADDSQSGALLDIDWVRFNTLDNLSKQVTQTIFVDCCRIDSYIADGSRFRPFKTLVDAINYRAGEGYNSNQPWSINLAAGLYLEDNSGPEGIILPTYTSINGQGIDKTILQSTDTNEDFLTTPLDADYEGCINYLTIRSEFGDNGGKGLRVDPKALVGGSRNQLMYVINLHISGFDEGIKLEEFGTWVKANFIFFTKCQTGIENDDARFWGSTIDIRWTDTENQAKEGIQCEDGEGKCEIYNLNIDGNFKRGLNVSDSGEVHAWNVRIDDCERGLQVQSGGEVKISNIKIKDADISLRIRDEDIEGTTVWLNDADLKLTTIDNPDSSSRLIIRGMYPSRKDCADTVNLAMGVGFLRDDEYENILIDNLTDTSKIETQTNTTFSSGKITLEDTAVGTLWENLDSIANWVEISYTADAILSLDTTDFREGTGSMKIDYNTHGSSSIYRYAIRRNISSPYLDWSSYDSLKFWAKSSHIGSKIRVYMRNYSPYAYSYFYHTFTTTEWELVTFDLTMISPRSSIAYFYMYFTQESENYIVNIDDMQLYPTSIYQTSGSIETKTVSPIDGRKFFEFLLNTNFKITPPETNITLDISLDDGHHWLTDIGEQEFTGNWISTAEDETLEFADGDTPWDNIKNLKFKINLTTTDTSMTPEVNSYGAVWRVDKV